MLITFNYIYKMLQIKNHIEQLKTSATRAGLIFSDNPVMYNLVQEMLLKLEQIEGLIELDNQINLNEVGEVIKLMYNEDDQLTHMIVKLQVRPVQTEVKECLINGKLYL